MTKAGPKVERALLLDALEIEPMASGHCCLNLSEQVGWSDFPEYAETLLSTIGGRQVSVADAPDIRLWEVEVAGERLRLVYDDYPQTVSLESDSDSADSQLRRLLTELNG
jgi:hypothetical protein